jgi:signal transduction histidine kinase
MMIKKCVGIWIGLYFVLEILLYHNSQILVNSKEGESATFYLKLPLSK